ncbi:phospholipid/cholesterol/gamma-HCH transport system substrate-binding protein [Haloechinothrix alba]|uniref:Phospholipid/cholesterol/gamma-HCH transport system substrate-binding protein n=1 Tax=Haloechinothrix alba TaxID=664784 RepID=A0A238WNY9_9PSEU|nr:MCE family protein [Haloechinothrix alba]SNR48245.1 phospholipid/cholesterol/gamma-HCH transport system substrate-binding protein [Haloechinothrix alba]
MRVPFRERDPRVLAAVGSVLLVAIVASSLLLPQAIFYSRTSDYSAELENATGLAPDDPVYVAGVRAGRVSDIEIAGDRAVVHFRMDDGKRVGEDSTASVKIKTVLGQRYLDIASKGEGTLDPSDTIPLSRTSVLYTLDELSRSAKHSAEELDLGTLRELMASLEQDTPDGELLGEALDGVSATAEMFTRHSDQFQALLSGTREVTDSILEQSDTLVTLLGDADLVADVLAQRKETISRLIQDISALSRDLENFVDTNRPEIDNVLERMDTITRTLSETQDEFDEMLRQFAPTTRYIANTFGQGPWGDVAGPAGPLPDNILCLAGLLEGCA